MCFFVSLTWIYLKGNFEKTKENSCGVLEPQLHLVYNV